MEVDDTFLFFTVFFLAIIGMMACSPRRGLREMFDVGPIIPQQSHDKPRKKSSSKKKAKKIIRHPKHVITDVHKEYSISPTKLYNHQQHPVIANEFTRMQQQQPVIANEFTRMQQQQPVIANEQQTAPGYEYMSNQPLQFDYQQSILNDAGQQYDQPPGSFSNQSEYPMTPEWQPSDPSPANAGDGDAFSPF